MLCERPRAWGVSIVIPRARTAVNVFLILTLFTVISWPSFIRKQSQQSMLPGI